MPFGKKPFGRQSDFGNKPLKMWKITCSDCGQDAEVPFEPREGSKVYCKECYKKLKGF